MVDGGGTNTGETHLQSQIMFAHPFSNIYGGVNAHTNRYKGCTVCLSLFRGSRSLFVTLFYNPPVSVVHLVCGYIMLSHYTRSALIPPAPPYPSKLWDRQQQKQQKTPCRSNTRRDASQSYRYPSNSVTGQGHVDVPLHLSQRFVGDHNTLPSLPPHSVAFSTMGEVELSQLSSGTEDPIAMGAPTNRSSTTMMQPVHRSTGMVASNTVGSGSAVSASSRRLLPTVNHTYFHTREMPVDTAVTESSCTTGSIASSSGSNSWTQPHGPLAIGQTSHVGVSLTPSDRRAIAIQARKDHAHLYQTLLSSTSRRYAGSRSFNVAPVTVGESSNQFNADYNQERQKNATRATSTLRDWILGYPTAKEGESDTDSIRMRSTASGGTVCSMTPTEHSGGASLPTESPLTAPSSLKLSTKSTSDVALCKTNFETEIGSWLRTEKDKLEEKYQKYHQAVDERQLKWEQDMEKTFQSHLQALDDQRQNILVDWEEFSSKKNGELQHEYQKTHDGIHKAALAGVEQLQQQADTLQKLATAEHVARTNDLEMCSQKADWKISQLSSLVEAAQSVIVNVESQITNIVQMLWGDSSRKHKFDTMETTAPSGGLSSSSNNPPSAKKKCNRHLSSTTGTTTTVSTVGDIKTPKSRPQKRLLAANGLNTIPPPSPPCRRPQLVLHRQRPSRRQTFGNRKRKFTQDCFTNEEYSFLGGSLTN